MSENAPVTYHSSLVTHQIHGPLLQEANPLPASPPKLRLRRWAHALFVLRCRRGHRRLFALLGAELAAPDPGPRLRLRPDRNHSRSAVPGCACGDGGPRLACRALYTPERTPERAGECDSRRQCRYGKCTGPALRPDRVEY